MQGEKMAELNIENNTGFITFKNEYKISDAANLKKTMIEAVFNSNELKLKMQSDILFDASFLQLFSATLKTCGELNKRVYLITDKADNLTYTLKGSGFKEFNLFELIEEEK